MPEKQKVLLKRQAPSAHRGSLRYTDPTLVILGIAKGLEEGKVSMLISPADEGLNRFRKCMDGLREDVTSGNSNRLIDLLGCKDCPIAETHAPGALPENISIGSELSADNHYSTWITAKSCPAILAMLKMVTEGQITSKYALARLFSEAPCVNRARRFAKIDVSK